MRAAAMTGRRWAAAVLVLAGALAACSSGDAGPAVTASTAISAAPATDVSTTTAAPTPSDAPTSTDAPPATGGLDITPVTDAPAAPDDPTGDPASTAPDPASDGGAGSTVQIGTGERPATLYVPSGYDPADPAPLVLLLHGYTSNGTEQDAYFGMRSVADARGYLYVLPDGTVDRIGNQFWNATDACCDFAGEGVDDSGYLADLITEVQARWAVDPGRVYVVGHSNGGFMSYRMACDHADLVAAIVSLAGATFDDPADCAPSQPVSVAQVHGTADQVVQYAGGQLYGDPTYPSAADTAATWAEYDGCVDWTLAGGGGTLDIVNGLPADATTVATAVGCPEGVGVELWTIDGGSHIPALGAGFLPAVFDFLDAHARS